MNSGSRIYSVAVLAGCRIIHLGRRRRRLVNLELGPYQRRYSLPRRVLYAVSFAVDYLPVDGPHLGSLVSRRECCLWSCFYSWGMQRVRRRAIWNRFSPSAPLVNNLGLSRAVSWLVLIAVHVNLCLPQAFTMLRRFRRRVFRCRRVASCFALVNSWLGL